MSPPTHHTPEAVLEHLAWVQRLARRLCADGALAEDISQEAVLAGVANPPRRAVSLRAWLGGVVRNRVLMARRGTGRRQAHEAQGARDEAVPAASEIVERASVQRFIVDAVLDLDEPYRTTVLLRFFEELSPQQIARNTNMPVSTVKTRLSRGLEQLRARLAGEFGEAGEAHSWMHSLAPLVAMDLRRDLSATTSSAGTSWLAICASTGALLMSIKTLFVASAAALVLVAIGLRSDTDTEGLQPEALTHGEATVAGLDGPADPDSTTGAGAVRTANGVPDREAVEATSAGVPEDGLLQVRVLVVDMNSQPLADVEVIRRAPADADTSDGEVLGTTDSAGVLEYSQSRESSYLSVRDDPWVTVAEGSVQPIGMAATPTVVVSVARAVHGQVLDALGNPVAEARVRYMTGINLATRFDVTLDQVSRRYWTAMTDVTGRFELLDVPELPDSRLEADCIGYAPAQITLEATGDQDVTLTLGGSEEVQSIITGRVLDGAGQPVADAWVSLGMRSVRSAADGRFQMDASESPDALVLRAIAEGSLPAEHHRPAGESWPAFVTLRLGEPALSIEGRVVDEKGVPYAGVEVGFSSDDYFGLVRRSPEEGLMMARHEDVILGRKASCLTDAEGRFKLEGLLPRGYSLTLSDASTLNVTRVPVIEAGTRNCELVLMRPQEPGDIAGRVVDDLGQPIFDASVMIQRTQPGDPVRNLAAVSVSGDSVRTDADGQFRFESMMTDGVRLFVHGGASFPLHRQYLSEFEDPQSVEIVLPRNGTFFVALSGDPERADTLVLLDKDDRPVGLNMVEGQGMFSLEQGQITGGRSPVYRAPVGGHTLVVRLGEQEIARVPVTLAVGPVQRVDF